MFECGCVCVSGKCVIKGGVMCNHAMQAGLKFHIYDSIQRDRERVWEPEAEAETETEEDESRQCECVH